jgi:hypothetical protein
MNQLDLDQLLGDERDATFHDAVLEHLAVSYVERRAELQFQISVGDGYRRGTLSVSGLQFLTIEAPEKGMEPVGAWITADGPLPDPAVQLRTTLPPIPDDAFVHYFFASDWNAFIVVAGLSATFAWAEN